MMRKQKIRGFLLFVVLVSLLTGICTSYAAEKGTLPVDIDVTSPKGFKGNISKELNQGWPITIRLSLNNLIGVGMLWYPPELPLPGTTGYLMYSEGSCWTVPEQHYFDCGIAGESDCGLKYEAEVQECLLGETYLRLSPYEGFPDSLTTELNPKITLWETKTHDVEDQESAILGPPTDPSDAGYGFGPSRLLPELVVLADTGVGLVYGVNPANGLPTAEPLEARNLAGFISSVGFELKDAAGKPSIEAHTLVKPGLLDPLVIADLVISTDEKLDSAGCSTITSSAVKAQINGGSVQEFSDLEALYTSLRNKTNTVRVFVVNHRPDGSYLRTLKDLNHDGKVDMKDAALDGYTLLSGEAEFKFTTYYLADQIPITLVYDLDGNHCSGGLVLPAGAGGLTPIER